MSAKVIVELARSNVPRLLRHCDAMEATGRSVVSIDWLRATFEGWGREL